MRRAEALLALPLLCVAAPAAAQETAFDIPAGRLGDALIRLGEQAGLTIAAGDPALMRIRSRALRGRMPVRTALARLLAGTGFGFEYAGPGAVRIVRSVPASRRRQRPERPTPPASLPPAATELDIVVTASKLGTALRRFGGSVHIVDLAQSDVGRFATRGSEAVLERLPTLSSTSLGPGRNKIFIRGVADSSFNGPSQSVVGQYLGDVRLTFNAPDPDLSLYDIDRVEVIEGPQGTLYGTGSLGGILRLVPSAPDLQDAAARATTGLATTAHGDWSGDASATVNLPLARGRLALRAVGYWSTDGGYIDDVRRGIADVNRTNVHGGRAALLWDPGDGWQIELGGAAQFLAGRDGQYAMRGLPPLSRSSTLAQPFDNDYLLGYATVRKRWPGIELVSATGVVSHQLETRFDATGFPGTTGPQLFAEDAGITLISHETRLSQPDSEGEGWLAGLSLVHDSNRIRRSLAAPFALRPITGVLNKVEEAALFGQYGFAPADRLVATLGGRITYSRSVGSLLDAPDEESNEPDRTDVRASPTASILWRAGAGLQLYARYQRGFRAGGLAVSESGSATSTQRFESDTLSSIEAGLRLGGPASRVRLEGAVSYARWADIQADLVDSLGLPFTTNLGDGRIYGLEVEASWQVTPALSLDAAAFFNESALTDPAPPFASAEDKDLPNIAHTGARLAAHFRTPLSAASALSIDAAVRYVGQSHLGIGAPLDSVQGDFAEAQIGARLDLGRFGLSLDLDNVTDARGNRFAFGNPFGVADGNQTTPLRPRTFRLGFDAEF